MPNQYTKAKALGLPKPQISEELRKARAERARNKIWTETDRKKHSDSMRRAVKLHPDSYSKANVSGRTKLYEFLGMKFKGSWELTLAEFFDRNQISFTQPIESFPYTWNGNIHQYFPDFYLKDYDCYVEVKGYKTDRDDCKWRDFPRRLLIIEGNIINAIRSGSLDKKKFEEALLLSASGYN